MRFWGMAAKFLSLWFFLTLAECREALCLPQFKISARFIASVKFARIWCVAVRWQSGRPSRKLRCAKTLFPESVSWRSTWLGEEPIEDSIWHAK